MVQGRAKADCRRTDLFARRRPLMDYWADYLAGGSRDPGTAPIHWFTELARRRKRNVDRTRRFKRFGSAGRVPGCTPGMIRVTRWRYATRVGDSSHGGGRVLQGRDGWRVA